MARAEQPAALSSPGAGKAVKSCERMREERLSREGEVRNCRPGMLAAVEMAGGRGVGVLQGGEKNVHLRPSPYCQVSLPAKVHATPARRERPRRLALWP